MVVSSCSLRGSLFLLFASYCLHWSSGFVIRQPVQQRSQHFLATADHVHSDPIHINNAVNHDFEQRRKTNIHKITKRTLAVSFASLLSAMILFLSPLPNNAANAYDGFAEYAQENKMQQSDVSCFINQCGEQTKALGKDIRSIQGIVCLGQCKGEQSCATRCFAEFGGPTLDDWLSCTIEENECVKVPKPDAAAVPKESSYKQAALKSFDTNSLIGTWYKTDGLNPNYDLFDCQTNTFTTKADKKGDLDMDIRLRISRPAGGFWENSLQEHMVVDDSPNAERTMSTKGKMYGLTFEENWYVVGESDDEKVPPFKLVAYQGRTLQGSYEGAFVYAKEPTLPEEALPAVRAAAQKAGWDFDKDFTRIDNTCPANTAPGSTTSSSSGNWWQLVVGEGGIIDWISPGWRGEYDKKL